MIEENKNIQLGLAEIWRREKLMIATIGFFALFSLIICIPLALTWGGFAAVIAALVPIAFIVRVFLWVESTPCPKCSHPYGGLRVARSCSHCNLEIKIPEPIDYSISFKRIDYKPLNDQANR
jgi:hypothetical protein